MLEREVQWLLRDKYTNRKSARFYVDVERLKKGEPVDYVIGWKNFLGCRINLSEKPLIPREETEYWAKQAIAKIGDGRVLDIFAGSGCIGIAVLKHAPTAHVTFIDSQKNCLRQIKKNLYLNNIAPNRCEIYQSNLFTALHNPNSDLAHLTFDFIFSNPPYVANGDGRVQSSVHKHEPACALYAGVNSLAIIKLFLQQAPKFLASDGKIFMEFSPEQKNAIEKLLAANNYRRWQFHRDQFNRWRWVEITSAVAGANKSS